MITARVAKGDIRPPRNIFSWSEVYAAPVPSSRAPGSRRGDRPGRGEEGAAAALTGGGPAMLGVEGSMRARDASLPPTSDAEAAEKLVQVYYRPRPKPPSSGHAASGYHAP